MKASWIKEKLKDREFKGVLRLREKLQFVEMKRISLSQEMCLSEILKEKSGCF